MINFINHLNVFQLEINTYKKFTTVYRPFMIKIKEELCELLLQKNHILFQMAENAGIRLIGNLLDPCPFSVCVTI